MNPKEVNRINYNNYYVGQNLDFLVRSKMRSESLSTPLKNTPPFYDDEVSSKMSLLGKRGYYDPGYIYGFSNQEKENNQYEQANNFKLNNDEYSNPIFTKEQYEQIILPKEHYKEQMSNNINQNNEFQNNNIYKVNKNNGNDINYNLNKEIYTNNNNNNININDEIINKQKIAMLKERQTPQKLDNFQIDKIETINTKNIQEKGNNMNDKNNYVDKNKNEYISNEIKENEEREYLEYIRRNNNGMIRNQDKIPNQDYYEQIREYNYINELSKRNLGSGNFVLPLTRNQILQGVLTENNKKQFYNK